MWYYNLKNLSYVSDTLLPHGMFESQGLRKRLLPEDTEMRHLSPMSVTHNLLILVQVLATEPFQLSILHL